MMDMLEEARDLFDAANGTGSRQDAFCAIAAALIALAERRPQFVQVGDRRFNADAITQIETFNTSLDGDGRGITIYLKSGPAAQLRGENMARFLLWHEQHANVVRLDVEAE